MFPMNSAEDKFCFSSRALFVSMWQGLEVSKDPLQDITEHIIVTLQSQYN